MKEEKLQFETVANGHQRSFRTFTGKTRIRQGIFDAHLRAAPDAETSSRRCHSRDTPYKSGAGSLPLATPDLAAAFATKVSMANL